MSFLHSNVSLTVVKLCLRRVVPIFLYDLCLAKILVEGSEPWMLQVHYSCSASLMIDRWSKPLPLFSKWDHHVPDEHRRVNLK